MRLSGTVGLSFCLSVCLIKYVDFIFLIFFRDASKFSMQYFKHLCMSPLLPPLCITLYTTVRKIFDISLIVELLKVR